MSGYNMAMAIAADGDTDNHHEPSTLLLTTVCITETNACNVHKESFVDWIFRTVVLCIQLSTLRGDIFQVKVEGQGVWRAAIPRLLAVVEGPWTLVGSRGWSLIFEVCSSGFIRGLDDVRKRFQARPWGILCLRASNSSSIATRLALRSARIQWSSFGLTCVLGDVRCGCSGDESGTVRLFVVLFLQPLLRARDPSTMASCELLRAAGRGFPFDGCWSQGKSDGRCHFME